MKEILQTKYLNLKSTTACASAHILAYSCIVHVEYVDQEPDKGLGPIFREVR